jgi:serine/threonine-protein kinase
MVALDQRDLRLSPEVAVWIAIQIADGLHAAHETRNPAGEPLAVVHRDVSPQNVLIAYAGHVKLIDFGIAQVRGRNSGALEGKLRYMSPEQARHEDVDRRTDVYALGVVLWEMLTMSALFRSRDRGALLRMVREPAVRPPSELVPEIPAPLDAVVMAALAPDRAQRIATAHEFRRRLVEAMPSALSLDPMLLPELLAEVMAEAIERDRKALPESLTDVATVPAFTARGASHLIPVPRADATERTFAEVTRPVSAPNGQIREGYSAIAPASESTSAALEAPRVSLSPPMAARRRAWYAAIALLVASGGVTVRMWIANRTDASSARQRAVVAPAPERTPDPPAASSQTESGSAVIDASVAPGESATGHAESTGTRRTAGRRRPAHRRARRGDPNFHLVDDEF